MALEFGKPVRRAKAAVRPLSAQASKPKCETCHSEDVKLLSLIHHLHQHEVREMSGSGGIEADTSGTVSGNVFYSGRRIVTQAGISKLAAPPDFAGAFGFGFVALLVLGGPSTRSQRAGSGLEYR